MVYVYENRAYEVHIVDETFNDEVEIFLIDPDTRESVSIYDLPEYVADDLYSMCYNFGDENV